MNFKPIELEDKPVFDLAFRRRYYENSWFTFTNLLVWRNNYSTSWAVQDESLYVRLQANGLIYFLPAFTPPGKSFAQAVDAAAKKAMEAAELAREATAAMESLKQFNEPGAETEEKETVSSTDK